MEGAIQGATEGTMWRGAVAATCRLRSPTVPASFAIRSLPLASVRASFTIWADRTPGPQNPSLALGQWGSRNGIGFSSLMLLLAPHLALAPLDFVAQRA